MKRASNFMCGPGGRITTRFNKPVLTIHVENLPLKTARQIEKIVLQGLDRAFPPADGKEDGGNDPAI